MSLRDPKQKYEPEFTTLNTVDFKNGRLVVPTISIIGLKVFVEGAENISQNSRVTISFTLEASAHKNQLVHAPFMNYPVNSEWYVYVVVDEEILAETFIFMEQKQEFKFKYNNENKSSSRISVLAKSNGYFGADLEKKMAVEYHKERSS